MGDILKCPYCDCTMSRAAVKYARAGLRCRRCHKVELADFVEPELEPWVPPDVPLKTDDDKQLDKLCEGTDDDIEDNREW